MGNTCKPPRSSENLNASAICSNTGNNSNHKHHGDDDDDDDYSLNSVESSKDDNTCQLCHDTVTSTTSSAACFSACQSCGHSNYCRNCWEHWIRASEERGLVTVTCPYCRAVLEATRVEGILGRPYAPALGVVPDGFDNVAAIDANLELQAAMRDLGYRCCTNCHAWIERQPGATENRPLECLCGERFCGECGMSVRTTRRACQCQSSSPDNNMDYEDDDDDDDVSLHDDSILGDDNDDNDAISMGSLSASSRAAPPHPPLQEQTIESH